MTYVRLSVFVTCFVLSVRRVPIKLVLIFTVFHKIRANPALIRADCAQVSGRQRWAEATARSHKLHTLITFIRIKYESVKTPVQPHFLSLVSDRQAAPPCGGRSVWLLINLTMSSTNCCRNHLFGYWNRSTVGKALNHNKWINSRNHEAFISHYVFFKIGSKCKWKAYGV